MAGNWAHLISCGLNREIYYVNTGFILIMSQHRIII